MAEGIRDIQDIRSESLSFKDGILRIDNMMPLFIKEAATQKPGDRTGAFEGIYNLLLWKDSLIRMRASPRYIDNVERLNYHDLGLDAFNGPKARYSNYRILMEWNRLMVKQYSRLGIVEPERYTDTWGSKAQIVELLTKLVQNLSKEQFVLFVKDTLEEGNLLGEGIPEGAEE